METHFLEAPAIRADPYVRPKQEEWSGATSSKFTTQRLHLQPKESGFIKDQNLTRKHYPERMSETQQWRPSRKVVDRRADGLFDQRPKGIAKVVQNIKLVKPRAERGHFSDKRGEESNDTFKLGIKTFMKNNRATLEERILTKEMGKKAMIQTMEGMRNNLPVVSKGDKAYRVTDYSPDFFRGGGLIAGSTTTKRPKNSSKLNVDFYENFKMVPPSPDRKLWKDTVRINALTEEQREVEDLQEWERTTLKEVDPKYRVAGEDSDEEGGQSRAAPDSAAITPEPTAPPKGKGAAAKKGKKK